MPSIKVSVESRWDQLYLYSSKNKMLYGIYKFYFFFALFYLWNRKEERREVFIFEWLPLEGRIPEFHYYSFG